MIKPLKMATMEGRVRSRLLGMALRAPLTEISLTFGVANILTPYMSAAGRGRVDASLTRSLSEASLQPALCKHYATSLILCFL